MDLPGYDDWKLATPPEYEREGCSGEPDCKCAECAEHDDEDGRADAEEDCS